MKKVVIMRGVPGSGKSTFETKNYPDAAVCSADFYHVQKVTGADGKVSEVYKWDLAKAGVSHSNCMNDFISEIDRGRPLVVVDNTNIRLWEIQNYIKLARLFGYEIEIVEMTMGSGGDLTLCAERNIHSVPIEIVQSMAALFEPMNADDLPRGSVVRVEYVFSEKSGYIRVSGQNRPTTEGHKA